MFISEIEFTRVESLAANNLIKIDKSAQLIDENDKGNFHSSVSKALHLVKRGRPDILTDVSLFNTRVNCAYAGDYKKFKRLSSFLNSKRNQN